MLRARVLNLSFKVLIFYIIRRNPSHFYLRISFSLKILFNHSSTVNAVAAVANEDDSLFGCWNLMLLFKWICNIKYNIWLWMRTIYATYVKFCTNFVLGLNVIFIIKKVRFYIWRWLWPSMSVQSEHKIKYDFETKQKQSLLYLFLYHYFHWTGISNKSIKCLVLDFSIWSNSQLCLFLS